MQLPKMSTILDLPGNVFVVIIMYLSVADICRFRLACRTFHRSTLCKTFFKKVEIIPQDVSDVYTENFMNILSCFSEVVRLNIPLFTDSVVVRLLKKFPSIKELCVYSKDIVNVCKYCKSLHCLIIKFNSNVNVENFAFLKNLNHLEELELISLPSPDRDKESEIDELYFYEAVNEDQHNSKLLKTFLSLTTVKHWRFTGLLCSDWIVLPPSVTSIECRGGSSWGQIDFDQSSLEKLVLERIDLPKVVKKMHLLNLRILELSHMSLQMFAGEAILFFPTLQVMKLNNTIYTIPFLEKYGQILQSSLQTLTIESISTIIDSDVQNIVSIYQSLTKLYLVGMSGISDSFGVDIRHSGALNIFITNDMVKSKSTIIHCN